MKNFMFDFNDSYTYNFYADFVRITGLDLSIISLKKQNDFIKNFDQIFQKNTSALIFGPGPYSPHDYIDQMRFLKSCIKANICVIGICLGHQMIGSVLGHQLVKSSDPKHGVSEELIFNDFWKKFFNTQEKCIKVQRYNSLALVDSKINPADRKISKLYSHSGEIMLLQSDSIFSMQFHPESVGTEKKDMFFISIKSFITECNSTQYI